ncbi:hypothetical protein E3Q22_02132 [Wallemia mellicola]|uniref:Late embryogenesis abundant protein LEA-2 subgroup domain-containing protein n=1 Tax=Wallemia mellicola TaxID=1708541 RepID=A0A4T0NIG8_9BASI|nr:hypothetical protein E3Q22_02132 [Wallemia mellicola]TIB85798.1 hypothetical protein E3Q19_04128 [Wallemia mellicola]TIB96038.1 hypothetical protein E3Q17_04047 [Wallemia mellicola]TIC11940.1 hypothetical protein E3Q14_02061 [Wallemia mellicola]TIC17863.1 hypothetical protein E3Q13_02216 [Wallemia mellicola]
MTSQHFMKSSDVLMHDNEDLEKELEEDPRNLFRRPTKTTESFYSVPSGNNSEHLNYEKNDTEEDYNYRLNQYAAGQSFDPAADFNNVGPRYVPFSPQSDSDQDDSSPNLQASQSKGAIGTVPAMGPEWQEDEIKDMSKSHRRKEANWDRKHNVKSWFRGQRKCFGITRKTAVFISFGVIIALILLLYFLIPRAPTFTFRSTPLLTDDPDSASFLTYPTTNFSYDGSVAISLDTTTSWIPIKIKNIDATVYDGETNNEVGTGGFKSTQSYSKSDNIHVNMPIHFAYQASDQNDQTWVNWHDACRYRFAGEGSSTTLSIKLKLDMKVEGLTKTSTVSQTSDNTVACPFTLPSDSP